MERDVGREGETVTIEDPFDLAGRIRDGKLQIGVFHGFEYAWVRKKFDGLEPLTLAVNELPEFRCYVVVRKDSAVKEFAGLKGKLGAVPRGSREESRQFLGRLAKSAGAPAKEFFKEVTKPDTPEDALDDVVDDAVQVTVVDSVGLERFEKRKPARHAKLRVLQESDLFPCTVVVYRPGKLDEKTLKRVKSALLGAGDSAEGKRMLTIWRLTGFQEVPESYRKRLEAIEKTYPPPEKK
jgi:ABC-type phosphate/phosphonate transport system substrate-binding protein